MRIEWGQYVADAVRFAKEVLKWNPDAKQAEVLSSCSKRIILNWGRQCGKSTVLAALAVFWAATRPGALVLVLGGVESHTSEFLVKVDAFLATMGWPSRGKTGKRLSRWLPNGSRIVLLTTNKAVRGHAASLVILDESAYIEDEVFDGVLPTIAATGGTVAAGSTPNGNKGRYYDLWKLARGWFRSEYRATENPRITAAFLDEMRRLKGDAYVRQEFLCEFLENGRTLLGREVVEGVFE